MPDVLPRFANRKLGGILEAEEWLRTCLPSTSTSLVVVTGKLDVCVAVAQVPDEADEHERGDELEARNAVEGLDEERP